MHIAAQTLSLTTESARPAYQRPSLPLKLLKILVLHEITPVMVAQRFRKPSALEVQAQPPKNPFLSLIRSS